VEEVQDSRHRVTAVAETLEKTALAHWAAGRKVNLEQSLLPSSWLDGHFVQGHVDTTGTCEKIEDKNGSWEFTFRFPAKFAPLVIEKGSITINGTSLTVFAVTNERFKVAIIPYTFGHTNLQFLNGGDEVNLEFDLLGKYINRYLQITSR
jgi:riboflavin synthase